MSVSQNVHNFISHEIHKICRCTNRYIFVLGMFQNCPNKEYNLQYLQYICPTLLAFNIFIIYVISVIFFTDWCITVISSYLFLGQAPTVDCNPFALNSYNFYVFSHVLSMYFSLPFISVFQNLNFSKVTISALKCSTFYFVIPKTTISCRTNRFVCSVTVLLSIDIKTAFIIVP